MRLCRGSRRGQRFRLTLAHSLLVVAAVSLAHRGFVVIEISRPRARWQQPTFLRAAALVAEMPSNPADPPLDSVANPPLDPTSDSAANPPAEPPSDSAVRMSIQRKEQLANQVQLTLGCELAKGDIDYGVVGSTAFVRLKVLETDGRSALRFSGVNAALLADGLAENRNQIRIAEGLAAQSALKGLAEWLATVPQDELEFIRDRKKRHNAYLLRHNPKHVLNDLLLGTLRQKMGKKDFQYQTISNGIDDGPKKVLLRIPVLQPLLNATKLEFQGSGETVKDAQLDAAQTAVRELKPTLKELRVQLRSRPRLKTIAEPEGYASEQQTRSPETFVKLDENDPSLTFNQQLNRVADNMVSEITWRLADPNTKEIEVTLENFRMRMMLLALARLPVDLRCSAQLVVEGELENQAQRAKRKNMQKQQLLQLGSPKLRPITRFALRVIRDAPVAPVAESNTEPFWVDNVKTDPAKLAPELRRAFDEETYSRGNLNPDRRVIELEFAGDGTGGPSSNAGKAIRFLQLAYLQKKKQVRFAARFTDMKDDEDYTLPGMTVALTLS